MTEESFPRGGDASSKKGGKRKLVKPEKDLFQTTEEENTSKKKKKTAKQSDGAKKDKTGPKKKKLKATKKKGLGQQQLHSNVERVDVLGFKNISQGMLILGVVKEIHDYELIVSLPNGFSGVVQITNISDTYKKLLQRLTEGDTSLLEKGEEFGTLQDLFRVGQPVKCKVLDVTKTKKSKTKLKLSVNPKDVNQGLKATALNAGMVLPGSVSSREDHGYVIDLGVAGLRAFLKNKDANKYIEDTNSGQALKIGQYIDCLIKSSDKLELLSGENRIINVAIEQKKVYRSVLGSTGKVSMSSLLPGMVVQATVNKVTDSGLVLKFLTYQGTVHRSHMEEGLHTFDVGQKVKAAVLFIHPTTKAVTLTQLTHLVTPDLAPRKLFGDLEIGDTIEESEVWRIEPKRGVYVKVNDRVRGLAYLSQLSDQDLADITKVFKRGTKHKCRVLDFNYADNVVQVTFKKSILDQQFLKYADIQPGTVVQCEVKAIHDKGVSVKVTNQIKGFIPSLHLADVHLRHPEKKFKEGNKLKCRVLTVDKSKNKLILCNKKTLVKSKYPVITSYDQCKPGTIVEGFIADIKQEGVLVVLYNNVRGFVPKNELSTEVIEFPEKLFYPGQVVKCRIVTCMPEQEKMRLSLKIAGRAPFASKELELPPGYEVGQMKECKIVGKLDKGFDVELHPDKVKAFLPKTHLSDYMSLNHLLMGMHKVGDSLPEVMCVGKTNILVVTNKRSLKQAEKNQASVKEFSQLKLGLLVAGTVRKAMSYGLFVDLGNRLIGLVPNKYINDKHIPEPSKLFKEGQSVIAKITEVDNEKKRFLLSLRMSDCYHGDTSVGIETLDDYLHQYYAVLDNIAHRKGQISKLSVYKIGDLVSATVEETNKHGTVCELEGGVRAFVTEQNMTGSHVKAADKVDAVVLYVDPASHCLELSINSDLVKSVKHFHANKFTAAKVGQSLKCEVHLIKEDFVLVCLKGHAAGKLAYLPSKKIFNDVFEHRQLSIGQINNVVVKKLSDGRVLIGLQMHESEDDAQTDHQGSSCGRKHNLKLGEIVEAVIHNVHEHQLNIKINGSLGRVHNTEIDDVVQQDTSPTSRFKEGETIKVKVIGFRDVKTSKYLPISHPHLCKSLPECSLKPSVVSIPGVQKGNAPSEKTFAVGDQVNAFMSNYNHHCLWMQITATVKGKVHLLNASEDFKLLQNPLLHFKTGCCYKATVLSKLKDGVHELSLVGTPKNVKKNAIVKGYVLSRPDSQGLILQLPEGYRGKVALTDLWDSCRELPLGGFRVNQVVNCAVIGCNKQQMNKCVLSMRSSRVDKKKAKCAIKDPEVRCIDELKDEMVLRGYVVNCNKSGIFVSLGTDVTGRVDYKNMSKYYISQPDKVFTVGKVVTVKILSLDKTKLHIDLSLLEDHTGVPEDIPTEYIGAKRLVTEEERLEHQKRPKPDKAKKRKNSETEERKEPEDLKSKKKKKKDVKVVALGEEVDSGVEVKEESDSEVKSKIADSTDHPRLNLSAGFSWDATFELPATSGDEQPSDSDDSLDEKNYPTIQGSGDAAFCMNIGQETPIKKKPKTRKEKKEALWLEEQRVHQKEQELLDTDHTPDSINDFERLVIQSPDSSLVWLRYMAFHLETAEIEKARAIAERALKTISFREEQEKLNVWVGYMNIENMYGSYETLMSLFERAVKHNEAIKVYQQLIAIFVKSDKIESAEQLHSTMLKKYSQNRDVWVNFGLFYFKNNKADSARKLLERSFKSLQKKDHVEVISKFAQMEFKHGEPERGKSMFENLLSTYPKRTDLWSVYIDMVTKVEDLEAARQLYERLIHSSLSAKKMKFCFKKYLEFEQKYGTEENINTVKQKAIQYVENKADVET